MDIYKIKLIKEGVVDYGDDEKITKPSEAAPVIIEYLKDLDREHFIVLCLKTDNRIAGINTVSIGSLKATMACPREVFKPAILLNANSIIIAHNHPSSNLKFSEEDLAITNRLVEAGKILDILVLDHILTGHDGKYLSLNNMNKI